MDWRTWAYKRITADSSIIDESPVNPEEWIVGAGSLTNDPGHRPLIVIRFSTESADINDGDQPVVTSQRASIFVHDIPGDYLRIDRILAKTRTLLAGNTAGMAEGGGIMATFEGNSDDLVDDLFGTIMKHGEYRFVGKVG